MKLTHTILATAVGLTTYLGVVGVDTAAAEGRRTNELAHDVAVRHRRLLVKHRFEFAPLFESTINADFNHIIGGGAKLEYHFTDMFSVGVVGVASVALKTKLVTRILDTLQDNPADPVEPSRQEYEVRLNEMPFHGAAFASLTPWYGKLAAFGQAYVAFDFYFQAGLSVAQLTSNCPATICTDKNPGMSVGEVPPDQNPNNDDPQNNGNRIGLYLGGGVHVFLNDFIALDLTVRDYAFQDNPSGADVSGPRNGPDRAVTKDDNRFVHHLFFGAGVSIMFPTKVKRTR